MYGTDEIVDYRKDKLDAQIKRKEAVPVFRQAVKKQTTFTEDDKSHELDDDDADKMNHDVVQRTLISQKTAKMYGNDDIVDYRKEHADSKAIKRKEAVPSFRTSVK
jgi:hypothetical protein